MLKKDVIPPSFPPVRCKSLKVALVSIPTAISLPTQEVCQASVMCNTCSTRAGLRESYHFLNFKHLFKQCFFLVLLLRGLLVSELC